MASEGLKETCRTGPLIHKVNGEIPQRNCNDESAGQDKNGDRDQTFRWRDPRASGGAVCGSGSQFKTPSAILHKAFSSIEHRSASFGTGVRVRLIAKGFIAEIPSRTSGIGFGHFRAALLHSAESSIRTEDTEYSASLGLWRGRSFSG